MTQGRGTHSNLRLLTVSLLLLILAGLLHGKLPTPQAWAERQLELRFDVDHFADTRLLRLTSFGHQGLVADLLLIRTVLGFGELEFQHDRLIENIAWFHKVLDTITDLDPDFRSAYVLGGGILALRDKEDYRLANQFLITVALDKWDSWQVPAWIGFNYYFMKEYQASIPWFRLALDKGAPSNYSAYLLATSKLGKRDEAMLAIQILQDYLASIDDPHTRSYLELRLQRMIVIQKIREAAKLFQNRTGRTPTTLVELVQAGLLAEESAALFDDYQIVFDNGQFRAFRKEHIASVVD